MSNLIFAKKFIAQLLAVLLTIPVAAAAQTVQRSEAVPQQKQANQSAASQQDDSSTPNAPLPQEAETQTPLPSQQDSAPQQNGTATPFGTAAAPLEKPVGVTGSKPAGAVIAPAKQRRVRTILISVGLLVGAGVAIGTVAALSHSSPSQPR